MPEHDLIECHFHLPSNLKDRLVRLCAESGASRSSVAVAAIRAFLENQGAGELERTFAFRLDRMSKQLARIERDGQVLLESLALFVRYMLTVNAPLPDEDEVGRAIGRDRFSAFVSRVGQQLAEGKRTFEPEIDQ